MSVSWQINPSDDLELNINGYGSAIIRTATVAHIKEQMLINNFDICVCIQQDYGSANAYDMHMFGYNDTNPIYLADKDFLDMTNDTVGCNRIPQGRFEQYSRYLLASNGTIVNQTGMQKNNVTSEKTINNVAYRYINNSFIKTNYPPVIIIAERSSYPKDVYYNGVKFSYTWSPVNKINGKMGNVNLSQIIYLNDGEPVTGADSEDVTFIDESGLDVLIEKATWVDDAVTVEYYIPNDTFEYVKLVYKYGDVPADINDGTAIDLDPNKTSLVITDIENPDNYWFIIFTDKSCSLGYELIINQDTALYNLLSGMF